MFIADNWKDYEVIDTSKGEKLERWGKYILVRPDPQVIWDTPKKERGWKNMNGHYHRSSKDGVAEREGGRALARGPRLAALDGRVGVAGRAPVRVAAGEEPPSRQPERDVHEEDGGVALSGLRLPECELRLGDVVDRVVDRHEPHALDHARRHEGVAPPVERREALRRPFGALRLI